MYVTRSGRVDGTALARDDVSGVVDVLLGLVVVAVDVLGRASFDDLR